MRAPPSDERLVVITLKVSAPMREALDALASRLGTTRSYVGKQILELGLFGWLGTKKAKRDG